MRRNKIIKYFLLLLILLFLFNAALVLTYIFIVTHNRIQDTDKYNDMINALNQIESDAINCKIILKDREQYPDGSTNGVSSMTIDGKDYIGVLEIPTMDTKLPVLKELTYPNLQIAPCRFYGSISQNNLIIGAHNYPTHFGNLHEVSQDDLIYFTDIKGNVFIYKVVSTSLVGSGDVNGLLEGDWDLALFTCTTDGRQRVIVKSELIN